MHSRTRAVAEKWPGATETAPTGSSITNGPSAFTTDAGKAQAPLCGRQIRDLPPGGGDVRGQSHRSRYLSDQGDQLPEPLRGEPLDCRSQGDGGTAERVQETGPELSEIAVDQISERDARRL